jgi:general secretion pathway protein K
MKNITGSVIASCTQRSNPVKLFSGLLRHLTIPRNDGKIAKQSGAALIMALLVVAIVAAISTALMSSQQIAIQRTTFMLNADQAYLDVQYAPPWILTRAQKLINDFLQNKKMPTWPQELKTTLADNSQLELQFWPAGVRFNLNNLAQPLSSSNFIFINLLQMADENITTDQATTILQNMQTELFGMNKLHPNNPTGNPSYITSPSQLRLVDGITTKIYQALIPYLIALPNSNTPINVNAAPEFLLTALLNKDTNAAASVVDYIKNNGSFFNTSTFLGLPAVQPYAAEIPNIGQLITALGDKYYLAHITITRDHLQYQWYSIFQFGANAQTITTLYVGSSL